MKRGGRPEVEWRDWSLEAFDEARHEGKLVLLDLTASWCHWCHVMDSTTYADPDVAEAINENFVPIRVDIDRRPDISDRYNRGGFPTTAFLSCDGETVWGATYLPPGEMKKVLAAVMDANASGAVEEALASAQANRTSAEKSGTQGRQFGAHDYGEVFEEIFSRYDAVHGGFGTEPKFPNPDCIELLLERYLEDGDATTAEAARHTLLTMADGLYDSLEGGVFRYSVTRDWSVPHYEKMLETNSGYLVNLAHAHAILRDDRLVRFAEGVAGYMVGVLRDPSTGGFFGSQDADESYYRKSRSERAMTHSPSIDHTVYAGWNLEAAAALLEAGKVFCRPDWLTAAGGAARYVESRLWNPKARLIRHSEGQELYLFEDQVSMLRAMVAMIEVRSDDALTNLVDRLIQSVFEKLPHPDGASRDVVRSGDSIGELDIPARSLVWNSRWSHALALYSAATARPELEEAAVSILGSFTLREVEANGVFAAPFLSAWKTLSDGPVKVEVFGGDANPISRELWWEAKRAIMSRGVVIRRAAPNGGAEDRPFAVVCCRSSCSQRIYDVSSLHETLARTRTSQA